MIQFSSLPGCWERHLQRQYNNPLFIETAPLIQQDQVDIAQHKDQISQRLFAEQFQTLLEEFIELKPQEESEDIFKLQSRIDKLYANCMSNGGDFENEQQGLKKLNQLIYESIISSGKHAADSLKELENTEMARQIHFKLLDHSIVAHLLQEDSPIAQNELVPTLLSEDKISLEAAMGLFDAEQQQTLVNIATQLLSRLYTQELLTETIVEKLEVIRLAVVRPDENA